MSGHNMSGSKYVRVEICPKILFTHENEKFFFAFIGPFEIVVA
jgi:hypothetical protein